MTGRERMIRTIEFRKPDCLPVRFSCFGRDDTYLLRWKQIGPGDESKRTSVDEFGCTWSRTEQANMGQITGHPLEDWEDYEGFQFPDPKDPALYEDMAQLLEENGRDKYVFVDIFMLLFERLQSLRGFSNVLIDLYEEPELLGELADRIVEYDIEIIHQIAKRFPTEIQGFHCTDDWGTENGTIISPAMWDEFFRPRYQRIFDEVHKAGWHVWLHSCGKITDVVDGLIDVGVDVLELQQPSVFGIKEFGQRFAGRVCFATLCDIQRTMAFGTDDDIRAEAAEICKYWSTPDGGLFLIDDENGDALGFSNDRRKIMYDAFLNHDPFQVSEDLA